MTHDKQEWKEKHQAFELDYHQHDNMRWTDAHFWSQWDCVFGEHLELTPDSFAPAELMVDVGCGSRPCLEWFTNAEMAFYIDPLLSRYLRIPEVAEYWADKLTRTVSIPAEDLFAPLVDKCAFVLCYNVLDHAYDWQAIIDNLAAYARPGGIVALVTDCGKEPCAGHPGLPPGKVVEAYLAERLKITKRLRDVPHRTHGWKAVKE